MALMKSEKINRYGLFFLVATLLFSSVNVSIFMTFTDKINAMPSIDNGGLIVKVHTPGDYFDDEQDLIWSPNDITENRVMQISVYTDGLFERTSLGSLNIEGIYNGDIFDILAFEINSSSFHVETTESGMILTVNYSYDTDTWYGNYTLNASLTIDGEELLGTLSGLSFLKYDYRISTNAVNDQIYMCGCDSRSLNITVQNIGSSESEIIVDLVVDTKVSDTITVSLDESSGKNNTIQDILLFGPQSYKINLTLTPGSNFDDSTYTKIFPISIDIYYENEDEEFVYLYQQSYRLIINPLKPEVAPEVLVSSNQFDFVQSYEQNLSFVDYNDTLFTLGDNWLTFDYEITNSGYYSRNLSLNSYTNLVDIKILIDDQNLTLTQFNQMRYIVKQNDALNLELFIQFTPSVEDLSVRLSVTFDKQFHTISGFEVSNAPQTNLSIITASNQSIVFESSEQIRELELDIALSGFDDLNYFINSWTVYCANSSGFQIIFLELPGACNEGLALDLDGSEFVYTIQIKVTEWKPNNNRELQFILYHTRLGIDSSLSQTVNLTIEIKDISNDETNQTNNNNTNGSNEVTNDENNVTNFDIDNDGIIDSVDDCPDTKPGDAVDEFGCTIIDTGTNDDQQNNAEQQQNSDNTASKSDETNVLLYAVVGLIIVAILGGILLIRNRSSAKSNNSATSTVANPVMPLPVMPLAPLEPVVLQQWTDANGYSWRQMSDQTIMWWNGTDWIPYGKN